MVNMMSMRAYTSHYSLCSLSALVSRMAIGFIQVGYWITTSGLFPFEC